MDRLRAAADDIRKDLGELAIRLSASYDDEPSGSASASTSLTSDSSASSERQQVLREPDIRCMHLDLMSLDSVLKFANEFLALNLPLHLLINKYHPSQF
jgi:hypothetical protein